MFVIRILTCLEIYLKRFKLHGWPRHFVPRHDEEKCVIATASERSGWRSRKQLDLFTFIIGVLMATSNCVCQDVPIDAPPGVRLRAATSIINPGSAELGDAINTTRQLMWAVGVHQDSVFAEVQTIVGYNQNFATEKAALERRATAATTASLTNANELRDTRAENTRIRTQLGTLTRERDDLTAARLAVQGRLDAALLERDGLNAARLAIQGQLDAALLERNTHRDENVRITAQLADLRRLYEDIQRNLVRVTAEQETARETAQRERDRYLGLDAFYRDQLAKLTKLQEKLVKRKTKHAEQIAAFQNEVDNYREQLREIKAQMAQIQRAIDPSLETKDLVLEINNLRAHPCISADPEESIKQALDRKLTEVEQTKKIKRVMMGAGFLAIEKPFDTLVLIGQIISAEGTYGSRTGGEKQIPTTTIDEIVKAVNILAGKTDAKAKTLVSSIADGIGVEVDQLPRFVMALRPLAILTENLKGAGKRDVFSELRGIAVKRSGVRSPLGVASPPLSPVIKSPTHPDGMDTVFAFAESIRRQVEEQHSKGRILGPDALAGWIKGELGLRRAA